MSKRTMLAIAVVALALTSAAWAGDTVVNTNLFGPGAVVNMGFNVSSGTFQATTQSFDTHSGTGPFTVVGSTNTFYGGGTFSGAYNVSGGTYGSLTTSLNASGDAPRIFDLGGILLSPGLQMTAHADLGVLDPTHGSGLVGDLFATAAGTNATMNMQSVAYTGTGEPGLYETTSALQGQFVEKSVSLAQNGNTVGRLYLGIGTNGTATIGSTGRTGDWGANTWATANAFGGTPTYLATGAGEVRQTGFGLTSLEFNGATLSGGGTAVLDLTFNNGVSSGFRMMAY